MVNRESATPLYVQIDQDVRELIRSQELEAGDRVPSELELASTYGVSRMTARKALDRLVQSGLLFRKQGKGTFVSPRPIQHGLSTRLSFSAAMDALGRRHHTVVLTAGDVAAPGPVAEALLLGDDARVIRVQRIRHVDDDAVALHDTYIASRYSLILQHDLQGSLTTAMAQVGASVVTSSDEVSATLAGERVASHLGVGGDAPVLRMVGTGYSADHAPLRYTEAWYRGDRFTFTLQSGPPSEVAFDLLLTA